MRTNHLVNIAPKCKEIEFLLIVSKCFYRSMILVGDFEEQLFLVYRRKGVANRVKLIASVYIKYRKYNLDYFY